MTTKRKNALIFYQIFSTSLLRNVCGYLGLKRLNKKTGVWNLAMNVTKNHPRDHAIFFFFEFATWKQHTGLKSEEPKNKLELQRKFQNG